MSKRLTGLNPLSYLGVEPTMPVNTYQSPNAPTPNDVQNFNLGDFWVDTTTETLYVLVSQQRGVATWITTFGGAASTFITDSGTATDSGGIINLLGDGVNTNTSASGNTINVNLDTSLTLDHLKLTGIGIDGVVQTDGSGNLFANNGTNGQILIGGGTAPAWTNITAGSNITIVNGPNSINISASGAGGGGTTDFVTDVSGPATELGGIITMAGGNNITTDGSVAHTVTFNLTGTTNHAVQVGNATGSLTSLAVGTDGQVLISANSADPAFATLTSTGGTITYTIGPNTLNLEAVGGGGGSGTIVTPFMTSDTWTKNTQTKYVMVLGWSAGGGGGSGSGNGVGGSGAGSGSFFRISGPSQFFGATEPVVIGMGGTGGTGVAGGATTGNPGTNGGISSFGVVIPPLTTANAFSSNSGIQYGGAGNAPGAHGGQSGGIYLIDAMAVNVFSNTVGAFPAVPTYGVGGTFTGTAGTNGDSGGGDGGIYNYYQYFQGTPGGGGGSNASTPSAGGAGGNIYALNGSTVLAVGGTAGSAGVAGGNGNNFPNLPGPSVSSGLIWGGTGGGGGGSQNGGTSAKTGGTGGFPGGGGGGGGGCTSGTSGTGGAGGNGLVIVIEWT